MSQPLAATIAERLTCGTYSSLDALVKDVDAVATDLLAPIKAKEVNVPSGPYGRLSSLSSQETLLWTAIISFQNQLREIVQAEQLRQKTVQSRKSTAETSEADEPPTNGVKVKTEAEELHAVSDGKQVLTLFANAPGPKQLFSSFQQPASAKRQRTGGIDGVTPALRESGLPSFIGTTSIPPMPADDDKKKAKGLTFGELFAPPSNLPKLQPPKPAKSKLTTSGSTVEFVRIDTSIRPNRRNSYNWYTDKLAVGQWLGYGGVALPQEPTSPQAKRKQ